MVDQATILAAGPFIARLAKGEEVKWEMVNRDVRPYAFWQRNNARYYDWGNAPEGSVAVHTLVGPVMKYGGWCAMGTEDLMAQMEKADNTTSIVAHLLEIDSGGGEATNIETVARFIRNSLKKPVVAVVNGVAASAAYYIAAAADEIYATEDTDEFGSIGVVLSFADVRPMYEEMGVKFHEIYASASTLKNQDFKKALEGDYEEVRTKLLDPYAEAFVRTVKEFRSIQDDGEVFKGQTYMAKAARKTGLIDGIKTWESAVDRAVQLGKKTKSLGSREAAMGRNANRNNSLDMSKKNFNRIGAVLGYDVEADADGGIYLQGQELQSIERNLQAQAALEVREEEVDQTYSKMLEAALAPISASLQTIQQTLGAQGERISMLEDKTPGEAPVAPRATSDPISQQDGPDDEDPEVKHAEELFAKAHKAERREW